MTLGNKNGVFSWEYKKEDDTGYYFLLTDTLHHEDYNVILIKDTGDVTVNGGYINTVPHHIAMEIAPRLDYFKAVKKISNGFHKNHEEDVPAEKKEEKKKEK